MTEYVRSTVAAAVILSQCTTAQSPDPPSVAHSHTCGCPPNRENKNAQLAVVAEPSCRTGPDRKDVNANVRTYCLDVHTEYTILKWWRETGTAEGLYSGMENLLAAA